jgi:hypothetical protein
MTIDPDYYQLNITIEVLSQNTQGFNISISPKRDEIIRDFSGRYDLMVNHFNNGMGGLELSIRYLPPGMSYQLDYEKLYPDRSTILILTTTSSTPIGKYFIFITGISNSDNSNYYTEVLVLNVVSQKPIFYFAPEEAELKLSINKETEFSIECLSIFGFDGEVRFQLLDLPDTIKTDLGNKIVKPPENITIKFTPGIETKLGEYTVTLLGLAVGSTLTNSAKLFIIVNPQEPTFNISVRPVDELVINTSEKGVIDLEIEPIAGFAGLVNVTVQGLPVGMSWNHEQFPVNISESTDISLEIKNTTEVGDFDITIIFTDESGNITIERDLVLKVYPMDEDADNGDGDSILYQIIILIILLIIIIIIFKLITRKPKKQNKQNARKKK